MWSRLQARIWPLARRRDCGELAAILRCLHTHSSGFFLFFVFLFFSALEPNPRARASTDTRAPPSPPHTQIRRRLWLVIQRWAAQRCSQQQPSADALNSRFNYITWSLAVITADLIGVDLVHAVAMKAKKKKKGFCQRSRLSLGLEQVEPEVSEALLPPSARRKSMFMCYCKYSKSDITGGWHSIYYFDIHQVILLERWRTHMWRKKKKKRESEGAVD